MRIGLINIEPKIVNTAYMQIAYHYFMQGDVAEWAEPLEYDQFDRLYCSSLFTFTDKSQVPARAICGGTGFDLTTKLPFDCNYDYSIYPRCDYSILWFSRGCVRNCPFCIVRQKEGEMHAVRQKRMNPKGRYIVVMDNNFFANPEWRGAISFIDRYPVNMQGVDVRTLDQEKCEALNNLRRWKNKQIKMAWDNPKENLIGNFKETLKYIKPYKVTSSTKIYMIK